MENTKRINIAIAEEVHKELKIIAASQGKTLAQVVNEAIVEKLDNEKAKI